MSPESSTERLQEIVREAAQIVSELPDVLKPVAFGRLLDWMAGSIERKTEHSKRRAHSRRSPAAALDAGNETNEARRARSGTSPKALVMELLSQGFFDEAKAVEAVRKRISQNYARNIDSNVLAMTLMRSVRDGQLTRDKNAEDQYEYHRK
jgi:hypothetical protein